MPDTDLTRKPTAPTSTGNMLWWLVLLIVGVAIIYVTIRIGMPPPATSGMGTKHPAVGAVPPAWRVKPLTGIGTDLDKSSLQGKVTLVNFWGTWCGPCKREFPHMVALARRFRDQSDFQLTLVSCEGQIETDIDALRAATKSFLEAGNTTLPTYYDPGGTSRFATMAMTGEEFGYPTTVLFDREGKVFALWQGYRAGDEIEVVAAVEEALRQPH